MCKVDITVSSNISNCVGELFETTYNHVAKKQMLLEGAWISLFTASAKYFKFTEEQASVFNAVGEQFYSEVIEAIANDDATGAMLYDAVENFVFLFAYFINEENVICKTA
ncbi:hypothetical protein CN383_00095 [Priestia megaterium]|uniref:hypothetical protein n=1 Tax=Priestia megaterium TaxID=1404 RepID=UPI000BFA3D7B|nr:hypothetical protein [Priestia megaterium]PFB07254.1 hypothetical protein CN383_00095 [Priestia megaterium]